MGLGMALFDFVHDGRSFVMNLWDIVWRMEAACGIMIPLGSAKEPK